MEGREFATEREKVGFMGFILSECSIARSLWGGVSALQCSKLALHTCKIQGLGETRLD